jgi:flagellar FliL protein
MANAHAAETEVEAGSEADAKPKKSIVKIILAVVGLIVLLVGTVFGTLFFSGYFNPKPPVDPDAIEEAHGAADAHGGGDSHGKKDSKPGKLSKKSPELNRFEYSYMPIEKDFLVNIQNSKKVMSLSLAIMTHYDERVFENVKKHDFALRSTILDILRQVPESEINKPEFRIELARKIRDAMNSQLEKYEDFGGIEDVFYTNFVIQ